MPLTFLAAAEQVLREAGEPLHIHDITERALQRSLIETGGATPTQRMRAQIVTSINHRRTATPFVRTGRGMYGLRVWAGGPAPSGPSPDEHRLRIPHYPLYDAVRAFLPAIAGLPRDVVTGLRGTLYELTGTPTETVSWTAPGEWIPQRLNGEQREAALRIWSGSGHTVNPRHMLGHWLLASNYALVVDAPDDTLAISARGHDFIEHGEGKVVREIDDTEGLLRILALVVERGPVSSGDLLEPWMRHLEKASLIRAESTARAYLHDRMRNLAARGYIDRVGQKHAITDAGLRYLKETDYGEEGLDQKETAKLWDLVKAQHASIRETLRQLLAGMDPYAFEHLIKDLLVAMGYADVEVTTRAGDKGVDVIGRIDVGITSVREVVQVKRTRANVQRPVLDLLRGSLHRFQAIRGTIVTTSDFAKGAKEAALEVTGAPITLINGEKLVDLLIEHGIGVRRRPIELLEIDHDTFAAGEET